MIKHIPIKVYEEIKSPWDVPIYFYHSNIDIRWVDNNGINTPYLVTIVNKGNDEN